MNWLDIVILVLIALFAFLGLRHGLIKEIISILAIVGAILAGVIFYVSIRDILIKSTFIKNEAIASISGFLLIMICTFVLIKLIGFGLTKITGTLHLNWFNRICGCCFGAIKGVIISFLIISALGFFFSEKEPPFNNSIFVPYIKETFSIIKDIIPDELDKDIHSTNFHKNKAKNIKKMCELLVENFGGKVPDNMEDLLRLPGVARKTANIVLSGAFGKIEGIAVDTHVKRVSARLGLTSNTNPEKIEKDLLKLIPKNDWDIFSLLLINHGRKVCTARKPRCFECFLNKLCPSANKFG